MLIPKQVSTRRTRIPRRRGIAIVIVLGLLAMTLAIGYSLMRSQAIIEQLQDNSNLSDEAPLAAQSGAAKALRKMHEAAWAGVDSTLTEDTSAHAWFEVSYQTGDTTLTSSSPDYAEFPFRVTITSKGYAEDPAHTTVRSVYTVTTVVQLSRLALSAEPAAWSPLQAYSVYQWADQDAVVQIPVRMVGNVCLLGRLRLSESYPNQTSIKKSYLDHLETLRSAGFGDYRPFSGRVTYNSNRTTENTVDLLEDELNLPTTELNGVTNATPIAHPGTVSTYRLYPGGKIYTVPTIQTTYGSSLTNITLGPNVLTNPLGVFRSSGTLELGNNAKVTGTIITDGSTGAINIAGTGVELKAADLPALYGSSTVYQLPVALVKDDLRIRSLSRSSVQGLAMVWDEYQFETGGKATTFSHTGRVLTAKLTLNGRTEWNLGSGGWTTQFNAFTAVSSVIPYFPAYLQLFASLPVNPTLTIQPASSAVDYHWQDWTQSVYVKAAADLGLRWEIIRVQDGW